MHILGQAVASPCALCAKLLISWYGSQRLDAVPYVVDCFAVQSLMVLSAVFVPLSKAAGVNNESICKFICICFHLFISL